jgi:hypothetical protein
MVVRPSCISSDVYEAIYGAAAPRPSASGWKLRGFSDSPVVQPTARGSASCSQSHDQTEFSPSKVPRHGRESCGLRLIFMRPEGLGK